MEEISSLDSFHAEFENLGEAVDSAVIPTDSGPTKADGEANEMSEIDTLSQLPGTPVVDEVPEDEGDATVAVGEAAEEEGDATPTLDEEPKENVVDAAMPEDEYDQISDGTFDVDENSQAASAEPSAIADEEDAEIQEKRTSDETGNEQENQQDISATEEKPNQEDEEDRRLTAPTTTVETEKEEMALVNEEVEKTSGSQVSTEFEEVDANVSASAPGAAEEADMLGESDMTLPSPQKEVLEQSSSGKSQTLSEMGIDNGDNPQEAIKDEDEGAGGGGAKKASTPTASLELDDAVVDKAIHEEATDIIDIEESKINEPIVPVAEGEEICKEAGGAVNADTDAGDGADDIAFVDDSIENRGEESTSTETAEEGETNKDGDNAANSATQETETRNAAVADEDEPEQEDEPVENVQEPEESDICLIPDDTETEMTEAEKEQAILARENAEKEDEEAAKEAETAKEQLSTAESIEINDADAQATEAGAEAAATEGNEECSGTAGSGDAPDTADEPLLEEMQSGGPTGEVGSTPKIIIAWIVASNQLCKQCGEEKSCGFRFKSPETTEPAYLCEQACCDALIDANQGKYFIRRKKFLVEEITNDSYAATATANGETEADKERGSGDSADEGSAKRRSADAEKSLKCLQCKETKPCKYFFKQDDELFHICNDDCFNLLNAEEPDKFKLKRHSIRVRNIGATSLITAVDATPKKSQAPESRVVARTAAEAEAARLERVSSFTRRCADCFAEVTLGDKNLLWETMDFCNEICLGKYQRTIGATCQTCHGEVPHQALGKYCVRFGFEIRQFCCAACLNEFKKGLKTCSCCQKDISSGNEGFLAPVGDKEQFKDFCSQACMRRYDTMCNPKKKTRNDICAVCNNDKPVRVEIVLDEKEHNFCSNPCFSAFKFVSNIVADQCGMCCKYFERKGAESFTIYTERRAKVFCSRICLNVYIIVNRKIVSCQWCKVKKYNFDMIYKQQDAQEILMCSLNCLTLYGVSINAFSRTVAKCDNCSNSATPQYHLTMSDASMRNFCTYQCVMQFQSQFARAPLTLDNNDPTPAGQQQSQQQQEQQAGNSTAVNKNSAPFPTGLPKRVKLKVNQQQPQQQQQPIQIKLPTKNSTVKKGPQVPVISTVSSLASGETETMIGNVTVRRSRGRGRKIDSPPPLIPVANPSSTTSVGRGRPRRNIEYTRSPSPVSLSPPRMTGKRGTSATSASQQQPQVQEKFSVQTETKIVTVPPYPPTVRNVQTSCKPQTVTVGFQCEPTTRTTSTQTGKDYSNKVLIPVPVPIYIPQPMYMYSAPFPVPVPIPLPIPVPIFIPTSRNSAQGILKEIKKIQDKMPADPFEAELLMMAEMVAEEKHESDSGSEDEIKPDPGVVSLQYDNVQPVEVTNNSYGEDVLQMALKMATGEYDQPTVDLESAMTANTITNPPPGMVGHDDSMSHMGTHHMQQHHMIEAQRGGRGRKRGAVATPVVPRNNRSPVKRQRLQELEESQPPAQNMQPAEKPDANMCLKYTFGVNAWKQWVMTKNADLEKSSIRRRPFKTELLQMTADELNYSLCLFVKEVRKPNGTEYAPDTIYYLVLGIQQYLYENGRIDNIFTDPYYERFTDCLDEVARKFSVLYNDSQYIVTRVEEEHLWECKQLGAHSPHVLLSTLMFFNTKHFNLTTVEEHMQLSFSHIMKHWKRSAQNAKSPGTRNVLLRFYPPQAGLDANPRKKKVYEQQENEENPLRCPVRLYEFYLSKCPESVKTRNDVFYLQPERSCVPDSPVWYSTQALSQESLQKMLHRVKMVKEINIALLTS